MATAVPHIDSSAAEEFKKLINAGKLSEEEAAAFQEKLLQAQQALGQQSHQRTYSISTGHSLFNFHIIKWGKGRSVQRLILQFDFQSSTLCFIQHGTRTKKIDFSQVSSYESEDGQRLIIHIESQNDFELDADSQDEKNKILRLLAEVRKRNGQAMNMINEEMEESKRSPSPETMTTTTSYVQWQSDPPSTVMGETTEFQTVSMTTDIIMDGFLEKKGHAKAFLLWPKRYVRISNGEFSYYRPDDLENALNILPLAPAVTTIKKVGDNVLDIKIDGSNRSYSFRVPATSNKSDRDRWFQAIQRGIHAGANERRRTKTMKEARRQGNRVGVVNHQSPQLSYRPSLDEDRPSSPNGFVKQGIKRAVTMVGGRRKTNSTSDEDRSGPSRTSVNRTSLNRTSSLFYNDHTHGVDVTTIFIRPDREYSPLQFDGKSALEVLDMLREEITELNNMIMPVSTGSGTVNMTISRMASMTSCLQHILTNGGPLMLSVDQQVSPIRSISSTGLSRQPSTTSSHKASTASLSKHSSAASLMTSPVYSGVKSDHESDVLAGSGAGESDDIITSNDELRVLSPHPSEDPLSPPHCPVSPLGIPSPPFPPDGQGYVPPPPPLPGMDGGFPPPPPPPPPPGGGGVPPPPPMPGMGPMAGSILPLRKPAVVPTQKMKVLHWTPLHPRDVVKSFWMDFVNSDKTKSLNLKELENLFSKTDKESAELKTKQVEIPTTLLDMTRARNIGIFLAGFHLPLEEIDGKLNMISEEEGEGLDSNQIVALKRFQPGVEDKEMYRKYQGDKSALQLTDQFLIKLCEVPILQTRLDLLYTIRELPSDFESFEPTLMIAYKACDQLYSSKSFLEVLQYVLAAGNYINTGTNKAGAYGIKLASLGKLAEFRANQSKRTLLHYLIEQLHSIDSELLAIKDELESVVRAADAEISTKSIFAELEVLQRQLTKTERYANEIADHKTMDPTSTAKIKAEVQLFVKRYKQKAESLDEKGRSMMSTYGKILEKFGEKPSTDSEDFFAWIAVFIRHFQRIHKELYPPPKPSPKVQRHRVSAMSTKSIGPGEVPLSPEEKRLSMSQTSPSGLDAVVEESKPPPTIAVSKPPLKKSFTVDVQPKNDEIRDKANQLDIFNFQSKPNKVTLRRQQPVTKEGYLVKKARDKKRFGSEWNKRYFILEMGQLYYSDSKDTKRKLNDSIFLQGVGVVIAPSDACILEVQTSPALFLKAGNEQEAREWFEAFKSHIAYS